MRSWIIIVIIILILVGILGYVYYFYEKPVKEQTDRTVNITLTSLDISSNKKVSTGYVINGLDVSYSKTGKTNSQGSTLEIVPLNYSYEISNVNVGEQKYYNSKEYFRTDMENLYRIELKLRKPGKIEVNREGLFDGIDNMSIGIKSIGYYQKIVICTKWGLHIVKVELPENYTKIQKPKSYSDYFNCYQTNISLDNEEIKIPIKYKFWQTLDQNDFIDFVIMDSDLNSERQYATMNYDETDVGGENIKYVIKI